MPKLIPALILAVALVGIGTTPALAGQPKAAPATDCSGVTAPTFNLDLSALCGLLASIQVKLALDHIAVTLQAVLNGAITLALSLGNLALNVVLPALLSLPAPLISLALSLPSIGLHLVFVCFLGH